MTLPGFEVRTTSAAETQAVGSALAQCLHDGDVLLLHGDLGAGKTTFTKGVASGLRIDAIVSSPSFALVNEYDAGMFAPVTRLFHLDLYRLEDSDDLDSIGFGELVAPADGVAVVEWPERALNALPSAYLLIEFETGAADRRTLRITHFPADGPWEQRISDLRRRLECFA